MVIVAGEAELLAEPSSAVVGPAYLEKYAAGMASLGLETEAMTAEFSQPIRVRPTKVLAW